MTRSPWPWWLSTRTLILVVCLGVLARILLAASFPVLPTIANTWDSNFYHQTATALAGGEGYSFQGKPTAFFPPAFPLSLGAVYALVGSDPKAGQFFNVAVSIFLGLGTILLAGTLWGNRAARWACLGVAVEPSQLVMPSFLMSEVLCGALLVGTVLWGIRAVSLRGFLIAGIFGALAGMTRGHGFLVVPAVYLSLWVLQKGNRSLYLRGFVIATLIAGSVLGVWASRNNDRLGHPVLIATNAGINLWLGNNPNARGGRADPPGGVPQTGDEIRDEALAQERALAYIKANPGRTLALIPLKAGRLWGFGPAVTYRQELKEKLPKGLGSLITWGAQGSHVLLLGLVLWGLKRRRTSVVLWVVLGAWTLGHLPFLGGARYLFPVHSLLIVLAAGAVGGLPKDRHTAA